MVEFVNLEFGAHGFLINHVFLPTEQAETNICWIIYQDASFKICLSLFGWKVNILPKMTIVQCAKYHNEIFKTLWTTYFPISDFWAALVCCLYLSNYSSSYLFEKSRSSSRWGAVNDEDMKNESPARGRISMSSPTSVRRTDGAHRTTKPKYNYKYKYLQISTSLALVRLRDRAFGARVSLLHVFQTIFQSFSYVNWNDRAYCTFE